jgi:hypothetical protein|tara:strand:- start:79 stop:438 length:360 start_codon:yes stop_codon:yes gene_type:complete
MSYYIAFLDTNNVVTGIVESPDDSQEWIDVFAERHNCKCVVTAKDGSIRGKYAHVGDVYRSDVDAFMGPSPYPSWVINSSTKQWESPVGPCPDDDPDLFYDWDESKGEWVIIHDSALGI